MKEFNNNKLRTAFFLLIIAVSPILSENSFSQDVQTWFDGYITKIITNQLDFETNIGYDKLLKENGWSDKYISGTLTFQPAGWYVADASAEYHITVDPLAQDVKEFRFYIGQKFIFTRYIAALRLDQPYFYGRYEHRFLDYPEDGTSEENMRMRFRLGSRVLINNTSLVPETWYIPFYFENFINLNGEAKERYSSRNRFVVGAGYKFSNSWRSELVYYAQRSRHNVEDKFVKTDVIFQLKVNFYF